jgi:hypothetical protein
VAAIADLLVARGIRKTYWATARLEIARRPDVLEKMRRAGIVVLGLGIESAQDKTLRSLAKGFDTAHVREYCQVLRRAGLWLHGYFIVGAIGESAEDILSIAPFAREIGLDTVELSLLRTEPYSGVEGMVAASPGLPRFRRRQGVLGQPLHGRPAPPDPPDIPEVLFSGACAADVGDGAPGRPAALRAKTPPARAPPGLAIASQVVGPAGSSAPSARRIRILTRRSGPS